MTGSTPGGEKEANVLIGRMLRERRQLLGLSQRDICTALGYQNVNFISMIERGGSNIPLDRLADFVKVYQLSPLAGIGMMSALYPAVGGTLLELTAGSGISGIDAVFNDGSDEVNLLLTNPGRGIIGVAL